MSRLRSTRRFAEDARRHAEDAPRYCSTCAYPYTEGGLVVEYWAATDRIFHCWCRQCGATVEVVRVERIIGHESTN